jgi:uncharacterized protein (DUF427 family)
MSLTVGTGPFSERPAGRFDADVRPARGIMYFEQIPHRIRGLVAGETVVDSRRVHLLHETGHLPVYYFPEADLRAELLEPSPKTTTCPRKGEATYRSLRVGDRRLPDAVWAYADPIPTATFLAGFAAFYWHALDEWFCEDEQIFGHPRDPYSRIDVYRTTRHVRVLRDGVVLADTRRARVLFETALPPRWYLPAEDVRTELLVPSPTRTRCAYKGSAAYFSVRIGDRLVEDLVWTYPDPQHDAEPVRDLLCFFDERVDVELDGELQERPTTQWSRADGS